MAKKKKRNYNEKMNLVLKKTITVYLEDKDERFHMRVDLWL